MRTLLALRALGLGDALTGVPALRGLRRAWPGHRVVLAAPRPLGEWLRSLGVVDDVLDTSALRTLDWQERPPEVAVNLHGRGPQSHRLLQELRPRRLLAFACPAAGVDGPGWSADEHEVDRWCRLVRSAGGDCSPEDLRLPGPGDPPALRGPGPDAVVVHPGAASGARRWPADRWAAVAGALAAEGRRVLVTGVPAEAALCRRVASAHPAVEDRCGRDDLAALAAVVGRAGLLLCGDTGVAHLATALCTPSVVLFGATAPRHWGPVIDEHRHRVLWKHEPGDVPGDPHADEVDPRLARVGVAEVLVAAHELLAGEGADEFPARERSTPA